jgi:hypothetical protein
MNSPLHSFNLNLSSDHSARCGYDKEKLHEELIKFNG